MSAKGNQRPHEPLAFNHEMVERARRIANRGGTPAAENASLTPAPGASEIVTKRPDRPGGAPQGAGHGKGAGARSEPASQAEARPELSNESRCRRPDCPILDDQARIHDLSKDLVRAMRKLRRDLAACSRCPAYETCPVLMEFNAAVQTAIQEVNDEWSQSGE